MTQDGRYSAELQELRRSASELRESIQRTGNSTLKRVAEGATEAFRGTLEQLGAPELWLELQNLLRRLTNETEPAAVDGFGLDQEFLARWQPLLRFLYERWWRVQISGAQHLADEPRVLMVANRSGILPYDALMIAEAVEREHVRNRRPRFLTADWLVTRPFAQSWIPKLGGVRACPENAERLLLANEWVLAFPEGQKGALKPYRDRYRLQRFGRGGFVPLALRLNVPIIPVAVIGGEEVHPILYRADMARRWLGFPLPFTPTFPWLGPLGLLPLPSQWRIVFGEPLRWTGIDPERGEDPLFVNRIRDQIRLSIAEILAEELRGDRSRD